MRVEGENMGDIITVDYGTVSEEGESLDFLYHTIFNVSGCIQWQNNTAVTSTTGKTILFCKGYSKISNMSSAAHALAFLKEDGTRQTIWSDTSFYNNTSPVIIPEGYVWAEIDRKGYSAVGPVIKFE